MPLPRSDLQILRVTPDVQRVEGQPVPKCSKHSGERLRAAWRQVGRRVWHFYWCPMCDVPATAGRGF